MREINNIEIQMVSGGSWQSDYAAGVSSALSRVTSVLEATTAEISDATSVGQAIGLSYKAFGLTIAQSFLTTLSAFASSLVESSSSAS